VNTENGGSHARREDNYDGPGQGLPLQSICLGPIPKGPCGERGGFKETKCDERRIAIRSSIIKGGEKQGTTGGFSKECCLRKLSRTKHRNSGPKVTGFGKA